MGKVKGAAPITEDEVVAAVSKCSTLKEFIAKHKRLYDWCRRSDRQELMGRLTRQQSYAKPRNYWTEERIAKVANKCPTRSKLKAKYPGAFNILQAADRWSEFPHLAELKGRSWKTKEEVLWAVRQCETRTEFQNRFPGARQAARKRGWYKECCALLPVRCSLSHRHIYAIEAVGKKLVYVGLSRDPAGRLHQHKARVRSNMRELLAGPHRLVVVTKEPVAAKEAASLEGNVCRRYEKRGWTLTNVAKPGALGSSTSAWTEDKAAEIVSGFITRRDLTLHDEGKLAYRACLRHGWDHLLLHLPLRIRSRWDLDLSPRDPSFRA